VANRWAFAIVIGLTAAVAIGAFGYSRVYVAIGAQREADGTARFMPIVIAITGALESEQRTDAAIWQKPAAGDCARPLARLGSATGWALEFSPGTAQPSYADCAQPVIVPFWGCTRFLLANCLAIAVHEAVATNSDLFGALLDGATNPCEQWKKADAYASYWSHSLGKVLRAADEMPRLQQQQRLCEAASKPSYVIYVLSDERKVVRTIVVDNRG
jgi:hypothetical protein